MNRKKYGTVDVSKRNLRKHFREIRNSISPESKNLLDTAIYMNFVALKDFQNADTVLCYYPINSEPNILPIIKHAIELDKRVAFPLCHPDTHRISFHVVTDLSQMRLGAYGIPEPNEELPEICDFSDSLCIVPALSYDGNGQRLGYGGGYYDRFLSEYHGISVILAYSELYSENLPTDEYDKAVDIIITEKGGAFCNEKNK